MNALRKAPMRLWRWNPRTARWNQIVGIPEHEFSKYVAAAKKEDANLSFFICRGIPQSPYRRSYRGGKNAGSL